MSTPTSASTGAAPTGSTGSGDGLTVESTTCVIAGCGPAGAMLGLLLARAGVDVTVLEQHGDFLRDFRGDTIHASTLRVLDELELLDAFHRLPHQQVSELAVETDTGAATLADFGTLREPFPYIALVPQWDFLDFLTREAARYPHFTLRRNAEVTDLVQETGGHGRISGLRYRTPSGSAHEIRAQLTVAADGRHSAVREAAGLARREFGAPMDVLWLRLPRRHGDRDGSFGRVSPGHFLVLLQRTHHWQVGAVIPKGAYERMRARGIDALRGDLARLVPFVADRVGEIRDWDDVRTLRVRIDRLRRWHRPGLLCIGDAAHAMSPVGGVGINLAIQDAVAAANLLARPLARGEADDGHLARVQRRRWFPTVATQLVQRVIQRRVIRRVLGARTASNRASPLPAPLRLLERFPAVRRIPARFVAVGFRPEHVAAGLRSAGPERDDGGRAGAAHTPVSTS